MTMTIRTTGKRGRTATVAATAYITSVRIEDPDDYTPEYYEAKQYQAFAQNVYKADLSPSDRRELANVNDAVESEREISDLARSQH